MSIPTLEEARRDAADDLEAGTWTCDRCHQVWSYFEWVCPDCGPEEED